MGGHQTLTASYSAMRPAGERALLRSTQPSWKSVHGCRLSQMVWKAAGGIGRRGIPPCFHFNARSLQLPAPQLTQGDPGDPELHSVRKPLPSCSAARAPKAGSFQAFTIRCQYRVETRC